MQITRRRGGAVERKARQGRHRMKSPPLLPHLRRDWPSPCSYLHLANHPSHLPHLHRDWAHPATSAPGLGLAPSPSPPGPTRAVTHARSPAVPSATLTWSLSFTSARKPAPRSGGAAAAAAAAAAAGSAAAAASSSAIDWGCGWDAGKLVRAPAMPEVCGRSWSVPGVQPSYSAETTPDAETVGRGHLKSRRETHSSVAAARLRVSKRHVYVDTPPSTGR